MATIVKTIGEYFRANIIAQQHTTIYCSRSSRSRRLPLIIRICSVAQTSLTREWEREREDDTSFQWRWRGFFFLSLSRRYKCWMLCGTFFFLLFHFLFFEWEINFFFTVIHADMRKDGFFALYPVYWICDILLLFVYVDIVISICRVSHCGFFRSELQQRSLKLTILISTNIFFKQRLPKKKIHQPYI